MSDGLQTWRVWTVDSVFLAGGPLAWEARALQHVEYVTATTEEGRRAIQEVMHHSYADDIGQVPPEWTVARVVDRVPVAYIQVDPDRRMDMPRGELRYAFLMNVATREERRGEGHFRAIMQHAFSRLCDSGIAVVVTHGRYSLYRPLGFDVFTHHCGIFITPEAIEDRHGPAPSLDGRQFLTVYDHRALQKDLLLVSEVRVETVADCAAALRAAAALARAQGKARILFEEPPAPSYGSRYPLWHSLDTPFMVMARACGAEVRLQGANPEQGSVPDADWIKVLDAAAFMEEAVKCAQRCKAPAPMTRFSIATESGIVTIDTSDGGLLACAGREDRGVCTLRWPAAALAQLVTGYRSAGVLSAMHGTLLPSQQSSSTPEAITEAVQLLDVLFPTYWRFSRNESWVFAS